MKIQSQVTSTLLYIYISYTNKIVMAQSIIRINLLINKRATEPQPAINQRDRRWSNTAATTFLPGKIHYQYQIIMLLLIIKILINVQTYIHTYIYICLWYSLRTFYRPYVHAYS